MVLLQQGLTGVGGPKPGEPCTGQLPLPKQHTPCSGPCKARQACRTGYAQAAVSGQHCCVGAPRWPPAHLRMRAAWHTSSVRDRMGRLTASVVLPDIHFGRGSCAGEDRNGMRWGMHGAGQPAGQAALTRRPTRAPNTIPTTICWDSSAARESQLGRMEPQGREKEVAAMVALASQPAGGVVVARSEGRPGCVSLDSRILTSVFVHPRP